jgi:hypothetical protein
MFILVCYVLRIYLYITYCLDLYVQSAHVLHGGQWSGGSAAQKTDGKERVRALGFHLVLYPTRDATRGLTQFKIHLQTII